MKIKEKSKFGITAKINSVVFVLAIFMFIVVYVVSFFASERLEKEQIDRQLTHGANIMIAIDKELYHAYQNISVIAQLSEKFHELSTSTPRFEHEDFEYYMQDLGPWRGLFYVPYSDTPGEFNISDSVGIISLEGIPWQQLVSQTEKSGIQYSDVIFDSDGSARMFFSSPVRSEKEETYVGTIVGEFPWIIVEEMLDTYKFDYIVLHNNHRDILYNRYSDKINSQGIDNIEEHSILTTTQELGYMTYGGNQWELTIAQENSTVFGPIFMLRQRAIMIISISLLVAFIIITIMLHTIIITPIRKLLVSSNAMREGHFSDPVEVKRFDEIGQLMHSFNTMSSELKNLYSTMEKKVDEKTGESERVKNALEKKVVELERLNKLMVGRELTMIELKKKLKDQ